MLAELRQGPAILGAGAVREARGTHTGELGISGVHGCYAEAARRGRLYIAHNVAAQAISVALTTTYTGLCISNPLGNTKNLELLAAGLALSVAPAAIASLHVIGGYSATTAVAHTTPLAAPGIQNCLLGVGAPSTAKADSAATIVNPGYVLPLMGGFTAAALPASPLVWVDLAGLLCIPPGAWVALGALTAVTGFSAFAWEETEIPA
jgi:hypothetical protein